MILEFPRRRYIRIIPLILILAVSITIGCQSSSPLSNLPDHIQQIIKKNPSKAELAAYPINSPDGGVVYTIVKLGNGVLLAGTYKGIYRSIDGGQSWHVLTIESTEGTDSTYIKELAVVGESLFANFTGYILKSIDGGRSWVAVTQPSPSIPIKRLSAVDGYLYASIVYKPKNASELFRSADLGQSWQPVTTDIHKLEGFDRPISSLASEDVGAPEVLESNEHTKHSIFGGTSIGDTLIVNTSTGLYTKRNNEKSWQPLSSPIGKSGAKFIQNSNGIIFLVPFQSTPSDNFYMSRDAGLTWDSMNPPPGQGGLFSLLNDGGTIIAATGEGIFTLNSDDRSWKESNKGLCIRDTLYITKVENKLFVVAEDRLTGPNRQLYRSDDDGKTWQSVSKGLALRKQELNQYLTRNFGGDTSNQLAVVGNTIFAGVDGEVYRTDDFGNYWSRAGKFPLDDDTNEIDSIADLIAINEVLFVNTAGHQIVIGSEGFATSVTKWRFYRSTDKGTQWERLDANTDAETTALTKAGNSLYVAVGNNIYKLDEARGSWKKVGPTPNDKITVLLLSGSTLFGGASTVADTRYTRSGSTRSSHRYITNIYRLNITSQDKSWERLAATGLQGDLYSLWVDDEYPEVILAGTSEGLFWSKDGGAIFTRWVPDHGLLDFQEVISINRQNGHFFIGTDAGVFFVQDRIPRGTWYERTYKFFKQYPWFFSSLALSALLLIVLSTRLISVMLQLDVLGIKDIAPPFYLTPFGRWKLYRRFRATLTNRYKAKTSDKPNVRQDIYDAVNKYVDLPFEADDGLPEIKLSDYIRTSLASKRRVVIISDGGRGKSTLCHYLIKTIVEERLPGSRLEPVLIDGVTYSESLLMSITDALQRDLAYVNPSIVQSQLKVGNLLIIFDGFSEIRETALNSAITDIPSFIRQHPDTPFVFTSRSTLPSDIMNALGDTVIIRLLDIDDATVKSFLGNYLKRGSEEVAELLKQINIHFNALPRIPLMLKLVATVYDKKGTVPKDTATLFADYAGQVLRSDATGIDEPIGLNYAIRHLVRETFLRSGGDRGFSVDRGVELLEKIKDRLESYEIKLAPIKMINLLARAGLYKRVGEHLKFFHDSFESYFAARALESDFHDGKVDLLKECVGNDRLLEVWSFLNEILQEPPDKKRLEIVLSEREEAAANAAYIRHHLDPSVECRLEIEKDGNNYKADMTTVSETYPLRLGITPEDLARLSKELKQQMYQLSGELFRKGRVFPEALNEQLYPLANLGYYVYSHIFARANSVGNLNDLLSNESRSSIQVITDSFFFPWEMIYPLDPTENISYEHFWGLNHLISRVVVQHPLENSGNSEIPLPSRPCVTLFADSDIEHVIEEISFFRRIEAEGKIHLNIIDTNSFREAKDIKEIKEIFQQGTDILHFACHGYFDEAFPGNSILKLSPFFDLKLVDIESHRIKLAGQPLVVLNTGDGGNLSPLQPSGFAATFLKHGAGGVVATECVIPTGTASTFTEQLYTRLIAGEALGTSLLSVRKYFWEKNMNPVGLLYSLYARPSLKVISSPVKSTAAVHSLSS